MQQRRNTISLASAATNTSSGRWADDRGSIIAEYTMILSLLMLILVVSLQVMLMIHVKNTLIDSAHQVARYAALTELSQQQVQDRVRQQVGERLWEGYAVDVTAQVVGAGDLELLEVQIAGRLPLIGWLQVGQYIEVTGHALVYE